MKKTNLFKNNAQTWLVVALAAITIAVVVIVLVWNPSAVTTTAASASASSNTYSKARQHPKRVMSGPFSGIGGENAHAESFSGSPSADIQSAFSACALEKQMGDEPVLHAPPGVQPGTLISPPYGEVSTQPMFDKRYGYRSNTGLVAEKQTASGTESSSSGGVQFSGFVSRESARDALNNVARKFDSLLSKKLFPNAVVEEREDGSFIVKQDSNGGKCVFMENYYEYVQASMATEMGDVPASVLNWAKGSGIGLKFADIDKNIPILQIGLQVNCEDSAGYIVGSSGNIKSLATDNVLVYEVKWPEDQSVLVRHFATME